MSSCSPAGSRTSATSRCAPAAGSPTACSSTAPTVELRDPDALAARLPARADRPDVVWPALHGASGEDGALRGLLEFLGIPFVGSRSDAARLAWDKPTAKILVARAGVATPRSITLPARRVPRARRQQRARQRSPTSCRSRSSSSPPRAARPRASRSSTTAANLPRAMVDAYTYGDVALIEQQDHRHRDRGRHHRHRRRPGRASRPSRSSRSRASTASRPGTTPARPASTSRPESPTSAADAAARGRAHGPPRAGPAPPLARRPHRRRRRDAVVPRGERAARPDRDLAAAAGARGRRARPRLGLRASGRSPPQSRPIRDALRRAMTPRRRLKARAAPNCPARQDAVEVGHRRELDRRSCPWLAPSVTLTRVFSCRPAARRSRRGGRCRRPAVGLVARGLRGRPLPAAASAARTERSSLTILSASRSIAGASPTDEDRARVAGAQHAGGHSAAALPSGSLQQPDGVGDLRTRAPDPLGELLLRDSEVGEQLLVGRRLFQRVQIRRGAGSRAGHPAACPRPRCS